MANLIVAVNADTQDLEYGTSAVDWIDLDIDNDSLVFSQGSTEVADGQPLPSEAEKNQAGVLISETSKVIVPKYFLADASEVVLKEIHNAGDNNKRYVFAFDFDGATASEPVLEIWDNSNLNTINSNSLGAGTASNSWFWGVVTTNGLPGANWIGDAPTVGNRLAGSGSGYYLSLNDGNGALSGAKTLYCQIKIIVPANASFSGAETPVFVVKYMDN